MRLQLEKRETAGRSTNIQLQCVKQFVTEVLCGQ